MPFGDLFKLPEGFKRPRSAPNRMEGLTFPQKLNYMGQFEGPSLMALGAGIASGHPEQGWADMAKLQAGYQGAYADEAEQDRTRQQTMEYLIQNGIDPGQAEAASQNPEILKHIFNLQEQQQRLAAGGDDAGTYGTLNWAQDKDGKWVAYVIGKDGQPQIINPGEGLEAVPPGDIAGAKAGGAVRGEFDAQQAVAAPAVISDTQRTLGLLAEIKKDANKGWGTGFTSIANATPGTPGYDFAVRVRQAKATSMTQAIAKLRGLGSMSNADFQAAMQSITRMEVATSRQEFDAALAEYETYLNFSMNVARQQAARAGIPLNPDYPGTSAPTQPVMPPPSVGGGGTGGITIEEVPD